MNVNYYRIVLWIISNTVKNTMTELYTERSTPHFTQRKTGQQTYTAARLTLQSRVPIRCVEGAFFVRSLVCMGAEEVALRLDKVGR